MKKSFAARRNPRKIGQDDEDEQNESGQPQEPTVKRPTNPSKSKKRSSLRLSFGPGESTGQGGEEDGSSVFTPKKSNLSRLAIEKNAERKTLLRTASTEHLPFRAGLAEDRPKYSQDYLAELKSSTPSTPKNTESAENKEIDITAKFGPLTNIDADRPSAIPTEAEIREKKARRARLAKEKNFMSLDADEEEDDAGVLSDDSDFRDRNRDFVPLKEKEVDTRLVHEDEDIAEGFDEFVEDGGIALGKKAEREAEKKRRAEIASLIAEAEHSSGDDTDDSEAERNAAYEVAQTKAGAYGTSTSGKLASQRPTTPPKITPLPELSQVLQRLNGALKTMEDAKARKIKLLTDLRAEKADITEREAWIQTQLKETGERYEKLRIEAGMGGGAATPLHDSGGGKLIVNRGLESLGATPIAALSEGSDV